jgi:hypothetical protein
MRESSIAGLVLIIAVITIVLFGCIAVIQKMQAWFGVAAGFLAIEAIFCYFSNYFLPPKSGDTIKAPNAFARRVAGTIGIATGILWVLSAWPGAFFKK